MLAARRPFLHPRRGPLTAVPATRATADEQRRALAHVEAARIAITLDATLVPAVETGKVLLLRGWGWTRERERAPLLLPDAPPARTRTTDQRALELVLREAGSGRALADVPLEVSTPSGDERRVATDGAGRLRLEGLPPGVCVFRSLVDDARVETSYVAQPASAAPSSNAIRPAHLVDVERHRVRTGETPGSIAAAHGVPWDLIARFNWGTTDADALDAAYRETLGCTRSGPGGVRFDDDDDPGVLLVPRPWTARFAVGAAHEVFVAPLRPLFVRLENEAGLALPGARYELRFADGALRAGRLGRRGIARLDGVPDGAFTLSYPDELDLLATSLAASVRQGFAEAATAPLFTLLMQEPEVVARATSIYARSFDDLTGRGLAADIDQTVTDPEARRPLLGLCALAGLKVQGIEAVRVATCPRRPGAS